MNSYIGYEYFFNIIFPPLIPGKNKTRFSRVGNAFDGLNAGKTRYSIF
jgi:hypothetical protein